MQLSTLNISHVRNLQTTRLQFSPSANVLFGDNGSGKTSFLESIYLLGRGRSFRHRDLKTVVQSGTKELVVSGTIFSDQNDVSSSLGVKRTTEGQFEARYNGDGLRSASQLAPKLPLQMVDAHSFILLEGGAMQRRHFIDWGVFHVEQSFGSAWRRMQRALKQRNHLLRHDRMDSEQLVVWTKEFVSVSDAIARHRGKYLADLELEILRISEYFDGLGVLGLEYLSGWDHKIGLADAIKADLDKDRRLGKTHQGAHRADLVVKIDGASAAQRLSRGQLKRLIYILKLAQASLHKKRTTESCIFLLDDLPAELDGRHLRQVLDCLNELSCQYFVTGIEKTDFKDLLVDIAHQMFHVEQGKISLV